MGTKAAKAQKGEASDVIFKTYSNGVKTNRDAWACNFSRDALTENMSKMIEIYNTEMARWGQHIGREDDLNDFLESDDTQIKWSSTLKQKLQRGQITEFSEAKIRQSLYRAFTKSNLYFDRIMNDRVLALLVYNDFLTLGNIPPTVFDYRLGNRSALEWIIDQYRVKTDKRSGIVNDPNPLDDPQYIVKLIGKVITVSLEMVDIVSKLPLLEIKS